MNRGVRRVLYGAALFLVAGYCFVALRDLWPAAIGCDFTPLRHAAHDLLAGHSVYGDHGFVYPPVAAVVLAPLAFGSTQGAASAWLTTSLLALAAAAILLLAAAHRKPTVVVAGAALIFFGSCVAADSLWLGNLSVLLVPVALGAALAFDRQRWLLGSAIVVASILLKPLLVPLIVIPVLHRQWRAVGTASGAGAAVLLISVVAVPGGGSLPTVVKSWFTATNLHGSNAANNLSLRGWVEAQHGPSVLGLAGSAVVITVALLVLARRGRSLDAVRLAPLLLGAVLLAGGISEVHYLLTFAALCLLAGARGGDRHLLLRLAPGLILLAMPASLRDPVVSAGMPRQTWYVAAELLLFAGLCLSSRPAPSRPRPRPAQRLEIAAVAT